MLCLVIEMRKKQIVASKNYKNEEEYDSRKG
jgi:hypothetical protein